jgi:NAD(P)H-dependent FMN reductase
MATDTSKGVANMADVKILALVGSLRAASINRQLADLAAKTAPEGVAVTVFDGLGDLPFYNEDIDNEDVPASVVALREAAGEADAALVVTPEYNGSIPGVLKNAIDWLSRPFGNSALKGKPAAVIGGSFGQYGGVWAHDETRKSFGIAGPRVVEDLTLSVPFKSLDGKHPRENAEVVASLRDIVGKLAAEGG